jgi:hypothetical protein
MARFDVTRVSLLSAINRRASVGHFSVGWPPVSGDNITVCLLAAFFPTLRYFPLFLLAGLLSGD